MPLTAAALPEVSADFRRFVFTLQRGIFFADDPVFKVTFFSFGELIKRSLDGQLTMWGLMLACMPCMAYNHAIVTDLLQPGVREPLRHPFNSEWCADVGGQAGWG